MKRTSFLVLWLVLALALAGVGCAKKPDDAKISSEIQGKFSQDSGLSAKQLTVQANNGVITLGGTVDNEAQREAASRQAASVAGVREVVNNLQVGNAPAAAVRGLSGNAGLRRGADRASQQGHEQKNQEASQVWGFRRRQRSRHRLES